VRVRLTTVRLLTVFTPGFVADFVVTVAFVLADVADLTGLFLRLWAVVGVGAPNTFVAKKAKTTYKPIR
jgi:hypothetical protein